MPRASITFLLVVAGCGLGFIACAYEAAPAAPSTASRPAAGQARPGSPAPGGGVGERARVITVDTRLLVDDVPGAAARLRSQVAAHGGYVSAGQVYGDESERSVHLEIRVPAARLAALRAALAKLGEISDESEKVEDVTDQRADLGARLRNARVHETRLLELLAKRTGTLAEVIAVEQGLAKVRETVERLEAQQRGLEGQIEYATVRVQLRPHEVAVWRHPGKSIQRAAHSGLHGAFALAVGAVVVAAYVGPSLLLVAGLGLVVALPVWLTLRRRRRRRASA